jgi:hypothetical protein
MIKNNMAISHDGHYTIDQLIMDLMCSTAIKKKQDEDIISKKINSTLC